jgi:hypothetical protein
MRWHEALSDMMKETETMMTDSWQQQSDSDRRTLRRLEATERMDWESRLLHTGQVDGEGMVMAEPWRAAQWTGTLLPPSLVWRPGGNSLWRAVQRTIGTLLRRAAGGRRLSRRPLPERGSATAPTVHR